MGRSGGNKDSVVDESGCCGRLFRNYMNRETICHPLFFSTFIVFLLLSFVDIFPIIFSNSFLHVTSSYHVYADEVINSIQKLYEHNGHTK